MVDAIGVQQFLTADVFSWPLLDMLEPFVFLTLILLLIHESFIQLLPFYF